MTSHTKNWKHAKKDEIVNVAKQYPVVAVATLEKLPANILSVLRKRLHGEGQIIVAKTRVVQKAMAEAGVTNPDLDAVVAKSVALIFTKKNPFDLFSFVKKNKGDSFAKEGDIAISDILVQAGDTGLPPGPALATLKGAGLEVKMMGPTISISKDKVVTKKGDVVKKEVAEVLSKLNMKTMKVGMKIIGVFDGNEKYYYSSNALDVDEEELFDKFVLAYQQAFNLAVNAEYYTDATMEVIVMKAAREAKAVKEALEPAQEQTSETATAETPSETPSEAPVEVSADASAEAPSQ